MVLTANILGGVLGGSAFAEIGARLIYRQKFQMPWRSKVIGEFPFHEFVEKANPPIYFQFKKGYRSKYVNINSLGMRSAEPEPNSQKKKLLLIGESLFFGAKILNEKGIWSYQLQDILEQNNINNWKIYNAGFPGYNSYQYATWWDAIKTIKPDILILQMGANDITQAYVMGENWKPGLPWPWEFIMRQQRKSNRLQKLLFHSCFYFFYRRGKMTERKGFESRSNIFKLDECRNCIVENAKKIVSEAQSMGTKVMLATVATAYDLNSIKDNPPQLDAIQSNWRESLESTGTPIIEFNNWWSDEFAKQIDSPALNLQEIFWSHPKRYEMYLDVMHWNETGHKVAAKAIFRKVKELNWW